MLSPRPFAEWMLSAATLASRSAATWSCISATSGDTTPTPAEVLPRWKAGIETEVHNAIIRDALWFALYTGMLREEVLTLNWERIDIEARTFKVRHSRGIVSPELPVTTQLAAILDKRHAESGSPAPGLRAWVFPSPTSASRHLKDTKHLYSRISEAAGAKFWFQCMRNAT